MLYFSNFNNYILVSLQKMLQHISISFSDTKRSYIYIKQNPLIREAYTKDF